MRERKLTELTAMLIRRLYADGLSSYDLGPWFGVSPTTIHCIVRGSLYRHVPGYELTPKELDYQHMFRQSGYQAFYDKWKKNSEKEHEKWMRIARRKLAECRQLVKDLEA